jgi:adenylate cyclase
MPTLGSPRALIVQWDYGSVEDFAPLVRQARESALQAVALDREDPQAQYVLAQTSHWAGDVRSAVAHASRAIELNANFALGHFYLGIGLSLDGRHEEALEAIETGWRLSPRDPRASTWLANKARVLYHLRRYEEAIETALSARRIRLTRMASSSWSRVMLNSGAMKRPEEHWQIYAPCLATA